MSALNRLRIRRAHRYDTNQHSPNLAPAYGQYDAEDVQGMWLVRSYIYLAVAGVDRAHMFMLANVDDTSGNKFSTSGLTLAEESSYVGGKRLGCSLGRSGRTPRLLAFPPLACVCGFVTTSRSTSLLNR
jgi:hypothetical protein